LTLFDQAEADRRREQGLAAATATEARQALLAQAQAIAVALCDAMGAVTSDDVALAMSKRGLDYDALGNAAGAVFRGNGFVWTGEARKSARPSTHARVIRVWTRGERG